jgi:hypothetical protein
VNKFNEATLEELQFFERSLDRMSSSTLDTFYHWAVEGMYTFTPGAFVKHLNVKGVLQ